MDASGNMLLKQASSNQDASQIKQLARFRKRVRPLVARGRRFDFSSRRSFLFPVLRFFAYFADFLCALCG
jgi:hypothetical protein